MSSVYRSRVTRTPKRSWGTLRRRSSSTSRWTLSFFYAEPRSGARSPKGSYSKTATSSATPTMPREPLTEQLDANHLAVRWHRRGLGVRQTRSLRRASLRALVRPNAVEQGLVIRDYPALGDSPVPQSTISRGGPRGVG